VARHEQHRQVAADPAALEKRPGADAEQRRRIRAARPARLGDRLARRALVRDLMLLPQREEQLALAAEVVVKAADASARPLDDVSAAGAGESLLSEDGAGRLEQRPLGLLGPAPLPGADAGPGAQIIRHAAHRSAPGLRGQALDTATPAVPSSPPEGNSRSA